MSNFIYYEKLKDYEEQVKKAKCYDKLKQWLVDSKKPKTNWQGDVSIDYMYKIDYILEKMKEFEEQE